MSGRTICQFVIIGAAFGVSAWIAIWALVSALMWSIQS